MNDCVPIDFAQIYKIPTPCWVRSMYHDCSTNWHWCTGGYDLYLLKRSKKAITHYCLNSILERPSDSLTPIMNTQSVYDKLSDTEKLYITREAVEAVLHAAEKIESNEPVVQAESFFCELCLAVADERGIDVNFSQIAGGHRQQPYVDDGFLHIDGREVHAAFDIGQELPRWKFNAMVKHILSQFGFSMTSKTTL